jgi:hypothetical protein
MKHFIPLLDFTRSSEEAGAVVREEAEVVGAGESRHNKMSL